MVKSNNEEKILLSAFLQTFWLTIGEMDGHEDGFQIIFLEECHIKLTDRIIIILKKLWNKENTHSSRYYKE